MKHWLRSSFSIAIGVILFAAKSFSASLDDGYCYSRFIPPVICTDGVDSTTLEVITTGTNIKQVWSTWIYNTQDSLQLYDDGTHGDRIAGDGIFTRCGYKRNGYGYSNFSGQHATYGLDIKIIKKDNSLSRKSVSIGLVKAGVHYAHAVLGNNAYATRSAFFIADTQGEIFPGYPVSQIVCGETAFPKAYQKLYSYFDDAFDFIVVIPAQDLYEPETFVRRVPYCITVKNSIQHIGLPIFDESANYGSAGRLKAVIYHSWGNADALDHEQGHMWGMRAGFAKGIVDGLAGANQRYGHWQDNADIGGKMSEYVNGKLLVTNSDGTWRLRDQSATSELYSPLELYIMGLIPASDVPPIHLLTNPNYADPNHVTCDSYATVTIDDIMAAEGGPRVPAYPNAQTAFRCAFIFVSNKSFTDAEFAFGSILAEYYASDLAGSMHVMPFETAVAKRATLDAALPGMESVGIQEQSKEQPLPNTYILQQNYPNPFNAATMLTFTLNRSDVVSLTIYDALGRKIRTLIDREQRSSGSQALLWNGLDNRGLQAPSGIYIAELSRQAGVERRKLLLVR
jgi:hypothetical protein